ncbi:ATP-binding protein [Treponema sp.]|uniref:HAMP domain-containing sensor histidine kinase n=1 Tax=Treponema sp. TaxID=166 RepID=UPI00298E0F7C|nr:ATP-binding protein [Treponema sp.]MCR5613713.1 HAMP domain-containing protein [Treponema sp.]
MKKKFFISISLQISVFLIIIAFIPVAVMMALKTYETQQLDMMERSNVQQGRLVASALVSNATFLNVPQSGATSSNAAQSNDLARKKKIDADYAYKLLENMNGQFDCRIRIIGPDKFLIADSSRMDIKPGTEHSEKDVRDKEYGEGEKSIPHSRSDINENETFIYRLFSLPFRIYRKLFKPPRALLYDTADFYINKELFDGAEVLKALEGNYGAMTRFSSGGQVSITIYSALPVKDGDNVIGVVLVSRSTYKILQNLYELRQDLARIFLRSLIAVVLIALFLTFRITYPLKKLSREANSCADKKGRIFFTDFTGQKRNDEIGDLSRSFTLLVERLNKRIKFSQAFSSDISHEFKNPLTAIRTSAELLGSGELDKKEQEELSSAIIDEVSHLQNLLSGIRNISKIDAGVEKGDMSFSDETETIDVNSFIKNIISRLEKNYDGREIFFKPAQDISVKIPSDYIERVAENLIDNALSFGTKVKVTAQVENALRNTAEKSSRNTEFFVMTVEDNGRGIPTDSLEKIFDRFYSERDEVQKSSHTGLGLSIVKAITDSLEGSIEALNSEELGGAKFVFKVPLS